MDNIQLVEQVIENNKREQYMWCIDVIPSFPVNQLESVIKRLESVKAITRYYLLPDKWVCLEFSNDWSLEQVKDIALKTFKFKTDIRMGLNKKTNKESK